MITQKQFSPHSGFTLIELLVVVLVIGILLDLYRQGYLIVSIVKIPVIRPGFFYQKDNCYCATSQRFWRQTALIWEVSGCFVQRVYQSASRTRLKSASSIRLIAA